MHISLLPGWGLGSAPLQPLAEALARHHQVQLLALPQCATVEQALDELDKQILAGSWLVGWSLGGMLATALAYRRGTNCPGLISLASNPSFVAREDWPHAMAPAEFRGFSRMAGRDWQGTLQHFMALCQQGEQPRPESASLSPEPAAQGQQSLAWLAQLDNRTALAELQCPQLHLLAIQDALVPAELTAPLGQLNAAAQVERVQGSHTFVCSQAEWLAQRLLDFIAAHNRESAHA